MLKRFVFAVTGLVSLCAGTAHATWSILIVNPTTGEIGVASATCLTDLDLREITPMLVAGMGGLTAQSAGDMRGVNRTFVRDRMIEGIAPADILPLLQVFDPGHQSRQYGMLDALGRTATFSGASNGQWAGGVTGQTGDLYYAVQGNVLTGAPVVAMAEQAIIATPGDLPAKLMAAMEAAQSMGGDGRCSCLPTQPEACGSPPPKFEKSADIGYMLVARLGDFSAAYGVYDAGGLPWTVAVVDVDSDGKPDVVAGLESNPRLTVLRNITPAGSAMTVLTEVNRFDGPASPRAILAGEWTGDAHQDFIVGSASGTQFTVMAGDGAGGFTVDRTVEAGFAPDALIAFAGGILATGSSTTELALFNPSNNWAREADTVLTGHTRAMVIDPADANALFCAFGPEERVVRVTFDGSSFTETTDIALSIDLVDLKAGDVNGDGRTDLMAASASDRIGALLIDDGVGGYTRQDFNTGRIGRNALMADFDGDGDIDPGMYTNGQAQLFIMRNDDNTTYTMESEKIIGRGPRFATTHDMNGDGLEDIVTGGISAGGVIIGDNAGGRFAEVPGTGAGDFFLELNIADASRQDPDPVFQLREQFDLWRADLIGVVDAVQSSAALDTIAVPVGSPQVVTLNMHLRDWQLDPVIGSVNLRIERTDDSDGVGTISAIQDLGGGHYRATITAGAESGEDTLNIIADAGDRTVILTPKPVFRVTEAAGDFDGDGVISFFDVQAFLAAFSAGDLAADLNNDNTLDFADVQLFLNLIS